MRPCRRCTNSASTTNCPFMTEKPMGRHADEVRPVVERIEVRGACMPPFALPNRLGPIYARAKAMLAEGAFGTPVYLHFRIIRPTLNRYPEYDSPWMLDPAISGGWLPPQPGTASVRCLSQPHRRASGGHGGPLSASADTDAAIEDYAAVTLRSASGIVGTLETGYTYPTEGNGHGTADCRQRGRSFALIGPVRSSSARRVRRNWATSAESPGRLRFLAVRGLSSGFRRGDPPIATPRDCLRAVELIDAAYRLAGAPWA